MNQPDQVLSWQWHSGRSLVRVSGERAELIQRASYDLFRREIPQQGRLNQMLICHRHLSCTATRPHNYTSCLK